MAPFDHLALAMMALAAPGGLHGISDAGLATDVTALPGGNLPQKAVAGVPALHGGINTSMLRTLRGLAEATGLLRGSALSPFQRDWAVRRYIGVAGHPTPDFHLTPHIGGLITGNYRRVLSEDLGIGFGLEVARAWRTAAVPGSTTFAVDIDLVLELARRAGNAPPPIQLVGARRPDYILLTASPASAASSPSVYFSVLECKGSRTEGHLNRQLRSAVGQLESLRLAGLTPPGLAVATFTGPDDPWVYKALDPGEDLQGTLDDAPLVRPRFSLTRAADNVKSSWDATSIPEFGNVVIATAFASAAYLAGNDSAADQLTQSDAERFASLRADANTPRQEFTTPAGLVRGIATTLAWGETAVRIIQALDSDVDDLLSSGEASPLRLVTAAEASSAAWTNLELEQASNYEQNFEIHPRSFLSDHLGDELWTRGPAGNVLGLQILPR